MTTPTEVRFCHKHKVNAYPFFSKKQNRWFWKHDLDDEKACFVNSEEEDDGFREKQVDYANDQRGAK